MKYSAINTRDRFLYPYRPKGRGEVEDASWQVLKIMSEAKKEELSFDEVIPLLPWYARSEWTESVYRDVA